MNRCRPYRFVHPLRGCVGTRGNALGYRDASPDGDGFPVTYSVTHSHTDHSSLITDHSSHTFSAKERDSETGLSYFGARYYSSDLSVWLSVDPMSDKYPSTSPYTYCRNNPVILVDPNGKFDTRAEARKYRKEHHTGGAIKKSPENDVFSGNYTIENKKTGTIYTKPQYQIPDEDSPIYTQENDGVVSGPIIYSKTPSKSEAVMAGTLIMCVGLGADDGTLVGVVDDPLIPIVFIAGAVTSGSIMLFAHIKKKQSTGKSNRDRHDKQYAHGGKNRPANPNRRKGAEKRKNKGKIIN
nr:RHS repeat-associated core domain-containing protein [Frisingicoccus sp.]